MEDWLRQQIKELRYQIEVMTPDDPARVKLMIRSEAFQDALLEALSRKLIDLESQIAMMQQDPFAPRDDEDYDDDEEDYL